MSTSRETEDLNRPELRHLVLRATELALADLMTLARALIPAVARQMTPKEFEGMMAELRLKGERYYDAVTNPGRGRKFRHIPGERDLEGR